MNWHSWRWGLLKAPKYSKSFKVAMKPTIELGEFYVWKQKFSVPKVWETSKAAGSTKSPVKIHSCRNLLGRWLPTSQDSTVATNPLLLHIATPFWPTRLTCKFSHWLPHHPNRISSTDFWYFALVKGELQGMWSVQAWYRALKSKIQNLPSRSLWTSLKKAPQQDFKRGSSSRLPYARLLLNRSWISAWPLKVQPS